MKEYKNGILVDVPEEEVRELEALAAAIADPEPTPEERIAALEEQLAAAKILLGVE